DLQHFLLPAGQSRSLRIGLLTQHRKVLHDLVHAARQAYLIGQGNSPKLQVVANTQLRKNVAALRNIGHARVQNLARREIRRDPAIVGDRAAARRQQSENRLEHCRLARAVRSNHGRDRAAAYMRRGAVENRHFSIAGEDLIENEKRICCAHRADFQCPRYASMTIGLRRISWGVPSAMRRPSASTSTRVQSAMTNSIWCSITTKVALRSAW